MAQTIKLKRSSVAGNIPSTSDLALGEVAINTADGKMYIKKSVNGTDSIIDLSDSSQDAIVQEYQFTASANQTTFSGADDNNDTLYYTAGAVQIFLNGILLDSGVDYTATTNTSIVLAETVDANDYLQVFAFKQKISGGSVTVDTFTGNGSTTAFTLSVNPGDENNTRVFIDGVYQSKSNYSVSATTLTFTTAPPTGTAIEVESGNRDVALDTATNLDFPDNVKLRLGTSQDLQLYHDGSNSYINDTGTGDLIIKGGNDILFQDAVGNTLANMNQSNSVELYFGNAKKFETTSTGIEVTGTSTFTGNLTLQYAYPRINLTDTNHDSDYSIINNDGAFSIYDVQNNSHRLSIASSGNTTFSGSVSAGAGNSKEPFIQTTNSGRVVSNPAYSFRNDLDTGMFNPDTDNTIAFATGGVLALQLSSAQNVNIPNGSLMVGATTAPTHKLEVVGNAMLSTSDGFMYLSNVGVGNAGIYVRGIGHNGTLRSHTTTDFRWEVTGGEKMLLNSSGLNVSGSVTANGTASSSAPKYTFSGDTDTGLGYIGTNAVGLIAGGSRKFYVNDTTAYFQNLSGGVNVSGIVTSTALTTTNSGITLQSGSTTKSAINVAAATNQGINGSAAGDQYNWTTGGKMLWSTNNGTTAHLVLDGSGNVLFGKTVANNTSTGTTIYNDNGISVVRSAGTTAVFNRLTDDGELLTFRKDGTTVGSIGTKSNLMYAGTGDTGVIFSAIEDSVYPWNTSTNANRDAAVNLGTSSVRFKDVWLSNGIQGSSTMYWSLPHTSGGALRLEFGNYNNTARRTVQFYKDNIEPLATYTDLISLGQSTNRFKDFYLSGTAYIAGTTGRGLVLSNATESYTNNVAVLNAQHSQGILQFKTASTERMRITKDGNVGIGTSSPSAPLSLLNASLTTTGTGEGGLRVHRPNSVAQYGYFDYGYNGGGVNIGSLYTGQGAASFGTFTFRQHSSTTSQIPMFISSVGNVGIGTTNPLRALHIGGAGHLLFERGGELRSKDTSGNEKTLVRVNSSNELEYGWSSAGPVKFMGGGSYTERMRIHTNSNIGINDIAPHGTLTVTGPRILVQRTNDDSSIAFANNTTGAPSSHTWAAGLNYSNSNAFTIAYGASGVPSLESHKMVINTSGNVGIGNASPTSNLTIGSSQSDGLEFTYDSSNTYRNRIVNYWNSNTDTRMDFEIGPTGNVAPTSIMSVGYGGNVGIGTTSPGRKLTVQGGSGDNLPVRIIGGSGTSHGSMEFQDPNTTADYKVTIGSKADDFYIQAGGGEKVRVKSDGKVGIGTDSPGAVLEISGKDDAGASDLLRLQFDNSPADTGITLTDINSTVKSRITIDSGNTNDLRISSATKLHLYGGTTNGTTSPHLTVSNDGNVGIGTDSPTQKLEVAGTALVENTKLKAIAESNTDTAVDVFVYDTRKDSDGGAWRKRTQHTSWYNETLNTSTRGARKEFPCVAVIVAESNEVTIYDGDDPDMPMWMTFPVTNSSWLKHSGSGGCKAVVARDGIMLTGGDIRGSIVRFIADDGNVFESGYNYEHQYITTRNTPVGPATGSISIVNNTINDVAMTALPNAPIDADTGLPVPTIAVGTQGGTSVITDSGAVYDISGFSPTTSIDFYGLKLAFSTEVSSDSYITVGSSTVTSDIAVGTWRDYKGEYNAAGTLGVEVLTDMADHLAYGNAIYSAGVNGLTAIDHNESDGALSMGAIIASDYNTGWMNGDIKLATLSDTDTTNVTGSELISGGNFSNWSTRGGAGFTVNGNGTASLSNGDGTTDGWLDSPSFSTVTGKTYVVRIETSSNSGTGFGIYYNYGNGPNSYLFSRTFTFVANGGTTTLSLYRYNGHNGTSTLNSISVRLAEEDRSVNGNGLQVFGTVTKTAVATGAELVGYSGFSSSNYLQQPYNSDLDFGTGDFSINLWVKGGSTGTVVFDRLGADQNGLQGSSTDQTKRLYIYTNSNRWEFIAGQTGITAAEALIDISSEWKLLTCIRKNGVMSMYENGVHKHSKANTNSVGDTDHITRIGTGILWNISPHSGSVALVRVSATAPTAEQVKKMYNEEKHLFQTNAGATIAGTSDAVTALAYDDDTELLHVGSSWGRSVFQGLNRVEYSTDVVTTAISASNGFIVEE